jgi:outer membrane protein assembly factor BamD (BamD/ComL family)
VRVAAGEQWPSGCTRTEAAVPAGSGASAGHTSASAPASNLGAQNDLFAAAVAAKRQGNYRAAVTGFDRFLSRYPGSPLAESALVEKMRLLRATDPSRAVTAARDYLARFPGGYGHTEAEAIVAGAQ